MGDVFAQWVILYVDLQKLHDVAPCRCDHIFSTARCTLLHKDLSIDQMPPLLLTMDPALGRFDSSTLSEQMLMELLMQGFDSGFQADYLDAPGEFTDISKWDIVTMDANGEVTQVNIPSIVDQLFGEVNVTGTLETKYVPRGINCFSIVNVQLAGTFDVASLPDSIDELGIERVPFTGTFDCTSMPASLIEGKIRNTNLSGSLDLTALPPKIKDLYIDKNKFSGSIDLTKLPASIMYFDLHKNQLSGSIDLTHLPAGLLELELQGNQFSGSISLESLPSCLQRLDVSSNQLEGTIGVTYISPELQSVRIYENNFSGTVYRKDIPKTCTLIITKPSYGAVWGRPKHMKNFHIVEGSSASANE